MTKQVQMLWRRLERISTSPPLDSLESVFNAFGRKPSVSVCPMVAFRSENNFARSRTSYLYTYTAKSKIVCFGKLGIGNWTLSIWAYGTVQ